MPIDPRIMATSAEEAALHKAADVKRELAKIQRRGVYVSVGTGPPSSSPMPPDGSWYADLATGYVYLALNGVWLSFMIGPLDSAYVTHSTTQSIGNSSDVALAFDTAIDNPGHLWASGTNTRLTCQHAGHHIFTAYASFQSNGTGRRLLKIRHQPSGDTLAQNGAATVTSADDTTMMVTTPPIPLAQGDYVEAVVNQNSGGSLTTSRTGGTHGGIPGFGGYRIGP